MTMFPVHTKETLLALAPEPFKELAQSQPGTRRVPMLPILADHTNACSYFIVKRSFRVQKQCVKMQHGGRGRPGRRSHAAYYVTDYHDYAVARVSWATGAVEELSTHPDRRAADKALRAAH